nr:MAG TPA: holin [Caudoviricetes sp.]
MIKMINWTVRIKNKNFWLSAIPAVLLLVQTVAAVFGYSLDLGEIGNRLIAVVNAVFGVLVVLGVVNDPTTAGISDSKQARGYNFPKED